MGKDMNQLYKRVNKLEVDRAAMHEGVNGLTGVFKEFAKAFKDHDKREMVKYEKYDNDVRSFNDTLIKAVDSIKYLKESNVAQDRRSKDLDTKFSLHEETCSSSIDAINKRQNIAIGIIVGFMAVIGVVGFIYNVAAGIVDKEQLKNEKLALEVAKMKNLQNRNYGSIEAIKSRQPQ